MFGKHTMRYATMRPEAYDNDGDKDNKRRTVSYISRYSSATLKQGQSLFELRSWWARMEASG